MVSSFNRIKQGKHFDENYQPYTKEFLEKIIDHFLEKEDYESCHLIKSIIDIRFDHNNGFNNKIS